MRSHHWFHFSSYSLSGILNASSVHFPVKIIFIPAKRHAIKAAKKSRYSSCMAIRHDRNAVQHFHRYRLKPGKILRIKPLTDVVKFLFRNIKLGRLKIVKVQFPDISHFFSSDIHPSRRFLRLSGNHGFRQ